MLWIFSFQLAAVGSQISMPIPGEVEGALAAPVLPGPTLSLTKQRSFAATGGVPVVPGKAIGSPALNDLTSSTVVFASGLNAVFIVSSQVSATGADTGASAALLSLPPQATGSADAATIEKRKVRRT